jgi:hypothetical protein
VTALIFRKKEEYCSVLAIFEELHFYFNVFVRKRRRERKRKRKRKKKKKKREKESKCVSCVIFHLFSHKQVEKNSRRRLIQR